MKYRRKQKILRHADIYRCIQTNRIGVSLAMRRAWVRCNLDAVGLQCAFDMSISVFRVLHYFVQRALCATGSAEQLASLFQILFRGRQASEAAVDSFTVQSTSISRSSDAQKQSTDYKNATGDWCGPLLRQTAQMSIDCAKILCTDYIVQSVTGKRCCRPPANSVSPTLMFLECSWNALVML